MASILKVDKLDPQSGTALEIGSSGDTITVPSGATIVNSGTATGFGGDNTPSFYTKQASTQSIGNGSNTKVTLDSEVWDTDSAFASDKFTVPSGGAGKYVFTYGGYLVNTTVNGFFELVLYLNGASLRNSSSRGYMSSTATADFTRTACVTVSLADADYIELYVYQDNTDGGGGSRTLGNADYKAYLSGSRLIGV